MWKAGPARRELGATARTLRAAALTLLVLVCATGAARADRIQTKDGRDLEGTIVRESATEVTLKTRLGEMTLKRTQIVSIERGKTRDQIFEERWQAAKGLGDYFELGQWAKGEGLRSREKQCMKKVLELDPEHEGANLALGRVQYRGEWLTPDERDERARADEVAEKAAKGLVAYEGEWVTPEEMAQRERGLVLYRGRWMTPDDALRAQGFESWQGEWKPAGVVTTLRQSEAVAQKIGLPQALAFDQSVVVRGPFEAAFLANISAALERGRGWFDQHLGMPPGLAWLGERAAAFYLFSRDSEPYLASTDELGRQTTTVPKGWADSVKRTHGFYFSDPYCVSAARVWGRPDEHLEGHSYHHWGHLLLGRTDYDGRLLPPWYDEGFASLFESVTHGRNDVFCIGNQEGVSNQTAGSSVEFAFQTKDFRRGIWRGELKKALEAGAIRDFDKLAQKQIGNLNLLDIAMAMGIVEWLVQLEPTQAGEPAVRAFHRVLRARAPAAPLRTLEKGKDRQEVYDRAFRAACGMDWRTADKAWREWFLKTN